jgi:CRISPR-associated protein Cas1
MILYLTEQGAEVGIKRERLEIRKNKSILDSIRLHDLEQIILCGKIQVTTQALRALVAKGIDVCFLSKSGRFLGRVGRPLGKHIELRRCQFEQLAKPAYTLPFARACLEGKLHNQRTILLRYQRRLQNEQIADALAGIRFLIQKLPQAEDLDTLRGYEGRAAALYFGVYGKLFSAPNIHFSQRIRRPPPDPVNILLSFGYTLLGHLIQGFAEAASLDPYLGALHLPDYGRPSLALDLLEEWRPVIVDVTVLRTLNSRTLRDTDFLPASSLDAQKLWQALEPPIPHAAPESEFEDDPLADDEENEEEKPRLLLAPDAVKRWFAAYERRLQDEAYYPPRDQRLSYRQIIREQIYLFARSLRQEDTHYQPFLYIP